MKKYQCGDCKGVSTEKDWNEAIRKEFINASVLTLIDDALGRGTIWVCCPKCARRVYGSDVTEFFSAIDALEDQELVRLLEMSNHPLAHRAAERLRELLS